MLVFSPTCSRLKLKRTNYVIQEEYEGEMFVSKKQKYINRMLDDDNDV